MELLLDDEKLMKLIRARAALSELAYPDMTDDQAIELVERITTDAEFDAMVRKCVVLDSLPSDEA